MSLLRRSALLLPLAFVALAAAVGADTSMAQFIPDDNEVVILVDLEALRAEPELEAHVDGLSPLAEQNGLPALKKLTSIAVGLDIPDTGGAPQFCAAVRASASMRGLVASAEANGFEAFEAAGRPMYLRTDESGEQATITFSNDHEMMLVARDADLLAKMMSCSQSSHAAKRAGFVVGADVLGQPILYVQSTGFGRQFRQMVMQGAIGLAFVSSQNPEAQPLAAEVQKDLLVLADARSYELAVGFDGEFLSYAVRLSYKEEAAAEGAERLMKNGLELAKKLNASIAEWIAGSTVTREAGATTLRIDLPKERALQQFSMFAGMLAARARTAIAERSEGAGY